MTHVSIFLWVDDVLSHDQGITDGHAQRDKNSGSRKIQNEKLESSIRKKSVKNFFFLNNGCGDLKKIYFGKFEEAIYFPRDCCVDCGGNHEFVSYYIHYRTINALRQ